MERRILVLVRISLQENYEKEYKYGLVTEVFQLPDNLSKRLNKIYKTEWYNLGMLDVDTIIEIKNSQSWLMVSRKRN